MRVLRSLLVVALAALLGAAVHPTPVTNSNVTKTEFRNGVSPDAAFDGMVMTFINETTGRTTDDNGAKTYVALGDTTLSSTRARVLWKCDLATLASDFVVERAVLRFLVAPPTTSTSVYGFVGYRVLARWEESANWGNRVTSTATDTTWATAGLEDDTGTALYKGTSLAAITAPGARWPLATETAAFGGREGRGDGGYYTAVGSDSVYSYYGLTAGSVADRPWAPCVIYTLRRQASGSLANDSLWVNIDVTYPVRMWHQKRWANHGLMFVATRGATGSVTMPYLNEVDGDALAARIRIVSEEYSYHNIYSRRPALEVWGSRVTAASGGGGSAKPGLGAED